MRHLCGGLLCDTRVRRLCGGLLHRSLLGPTLVRPFAFFCRSTVRVKIRGILCIHSLIVEFAKVQYLKCVARWGSLVQDSCISPKPRKDLFASRCVYRLKSGFQPTAIQRVARAVFGVTMRVKQVYTPVLHLVEGLDTASARKEAAGTVHYDAISLGILGQGLPQRRLQNVIPLGCLHRPSPQDPKILRVHQHEPAVPIWLDSFVCFGLA